MWSQEWVQPQCFLLRMVLSVKCSPSQFFVPALKIKFNHLQQNCTYCSHFPPIFCAQQNQEQQWTWQAVVGGFRGQLLFMYFGSIDSARFQWKTLCVVPWFATAVENSHLGFEYTRLESLTVNTSSVSEVKLTRTSHDCTHIHKHSLTKTCTPDTHTHTHTLTQFGAANQSEWSRVGPPRSGWESCWNRSLSRDTQSLHWWFGELFCLLPLCNTFWICYFFIELWGALGRSLFVEWLNWWEFVRNVCRSPSLGKTGH